MGVDWSLREGYAWAEDKEHCEEYGRMLQADPSKVSARAKKRGLPQVALTLQGKCSFFSYFVFVGRKKKICLPCSKYTPAFFTSKGTQICLCFIVNLLKSYQELVDVHKIKQDIMN